MGSAWNAVKRLWIRYLTERSWRMWLEEIKVQTAPLSSYIYVTSILKYNKSSSYSPAWASHTKTNTKERFTESIFSSSWTLKISHNLSLQTNSSSTLNTMLELFSGLYFQTMLLIVLFSCNSPLIYNSSCNVNSIALNNLFSNTFWFTVSLLWMMPKYILIVGF